MESETRPGHGGTRTVLLFWAVALWPFLYVFSSGPALWVTVNARLPAELWNVAYWPLTLARDVIPGFHQGFQWYLRLWTG